MDFESINTDDLTLGQAKALIAAAEKAAADMGRELATPVAEGVQSKSPLIGKLCVVRTYSAGVHIGILAAKDGTNVLLNDAVRLWKWEGAFSLSEVAMTGVGKDSRIAAKVPAIELTQAIEIIPASNEAAMTYEPRNA